MTITDQGASVSDSVRRVVAPHLTDRGTTVSDTVVGYFVQYLVEPLQANVFPSATRADLVSDGATTIVFA